MKGIDEWSEKTLNDVMARVAIEREAFISQFMDRLFGEQKIAQEAIMKEEQQVTGLVTELRKVVEGSNNLLLTANTLTEKFNVGQPSAERAEPKDSKPFDIKEYQDTIAEMTTLVETTNQFERGGCKIFLFSARRSIFSITQSTPYRARNDDEDVAGKYIERDVELGFAFCNHTPTPRRAHSARLRG
jgi:hypothetical protein